MRFRTGDKVEVMNNKVVAVSWRPGEILSSRGHTYRVRYDYHCGMARDQLVEVVTAKFVRPHPPLVHGVQRLNTGDIVEVFYQHSWKIAAILKIFGGKIEIKRSKTRLASFQNQYFVRLLGCSQEFVVDRSVIRLRQTWCNDKWILVGKSSRAGDDVVASKPSTSNCCQTMKFQVPQFKARAQKRIKGCANIHYDAACEESPLISSRSLKRTSPYESSIIEAHHENVPKRRATERRGWKQRVVAYPVLEKVDAVAYPKETLGEKYMHSSYKILSHGYNQMQRAKQNDDVLGHYSGVRSSEISSSDSDACSVGSCSVNNQSPNTHYSHFMPAHCQETDTLCSDAESSFGSSPERRSLSLSPKEELETSIRRLELHAYRSTLEALYASGLLSWEQEALLTNLRIMLHISNDEHLKELKHLISTNTAISVR